MFVLPIQSIAGLSSLSPSTPPCPGLICVSHSRCPAMHGLTMGREVGFMISEGPWLFVGIPDAVKVSNTTVSKVGAF